MKGLSPRMQMLMRSQPLIQKEFVIDVGVALSHRKSGLPDLRK